MDEWAPPDVEGEMGRQFREGSWSTSAGEKSPAEHVREFTAGAGQPTPDTPELMSHEEVHFTFCLYSYYCSPSFLPRPIALRYLCARVPSPRLDSPARLPRSLVCRSLFQSSPLPCC